MDTNALSNWTALNNALRVASEKECAKLLDKERNGQRRINFLLRIFGKYNLLRAERERKEILKEAM